MYKENPFKLLRETHFSFLAHLIVLRSVDISVLWFITSTAICKADDTQTGITTATLKFYWFNHTLFIEEKDWVWLRT